MFLRCSFFKYMLLIIAVTCLGCSADNTAVAPEPEVIEPKPEPEPEPPHYDDGVVTIEIGGRFQTGRHLYDEMVKQELCSTKSTWSWDMEDLFYDPDFPITPHSSRYTIDVAVVSMLEVGLNEPTRIAEIWKRYRERGYRPLTHEEAAELRLQFLDQPHTKTRHKMAEFFILPEENDLEKEKEKKYDRPPVDFTTPYVYKMYHNVLGKELSMTHCWRNGTRYFRPDSERVSWHTQTRHWQGAKFAVVAAQYPR